MEFIICKMLAMLHFQYRKTKKLLYLFNFRSKLANQKRNFYFRDCFSVFLMNIKGQNELIDTVITGSVAEQRWEGGFPESSLL